MQQRESWKISERMVGSMLSVERAMSHGEMLERTNVHLVLLVRRLGFVSA